eukprot:GFUD01029216.1.p1 GENE.GFUD01029216.1~~GFUD01029216.1.p1  ORF type:complete len:100 (+),score=9.44 GFUD01029216.1:63-362(+)
MVFTEAVKPAVVMDTNCTEALRPGTKPSPSEPTRNYAVSDQQVNPYQSLENVDKVNTKQDTANSTEPEGIPYQATQQLEQATYVRRTISKDYICLSLYL